MFLAYMILNRKVINAKILKPCIKYIRQWRTQDFCLRGQTMAIMLFSPLLCRGNGLFLTGHGPAFSDFSRSAGVIAPNTHYLGPLMISSNVTLLENIPYTLSASCSPLKRATSFPPGPFPDLFPSNSTPLQVYHLCSKAPLHL